MKNCELCEGTHVMKIGGFLGIKEVKCICQVRLLKDVLTKLFIYLCESPNLGIGICEYVRKLEIPYAEKAMIWTFIEENRPSHWYQRFYDSTRKHSPYYWDPTDKAIRIKFIDYHIKKLNRQIREFDDPFY